MDHGAITTAFSRHPRDHQAGVRAQLDRLDALAADLDALVPGDPAAKAKLLEARQIAQSLYHDASGHPLGGRPDGWFLGVASLLNACAERHRLEHVSAFGPAFSLRP